MKWKFHSEALRIAHAVAQEFEFEVREAGATRVKWPSFTGRKPQDAFRVTLCRGNSIISVTTRSPRGGLLCDVAVSTRRGDWEWTQLPMGGSDTFPVQHILSSVREKLFPMLRK